MCSPHSLVQPMLVQESPSCEWCSEHPNLLFFPPITSGPAVWIGHCCGVFFRMLLFFPSILSIRMVHILPHSNPVHTSTSVPMEAISPAVGKSQPLLQKLCMAAVQGNPVFFQEKKSRGAQGQHGVSTVRVETLLPSSQ